MKIAHLSVGNRDFYLPSDGVDGMVAAIAAARASGEWVEFRDLAGKQLRILIPEQLLLVVDVYEVDDPHPDAGSDPESATHFDYDQLD